MCEIKIGDTIYGYHVNNNRRGTNGLPAYWEDYEVVGETKVSWLVGYKNNPIKVDKKTLTERNMNFTPIVFVANREEMEKANYVDCQRYKIAEKVRCCTDYDTLKKIEEILNGV
jgi:hypothetical protein